MAVPPKRTSGFGKAVNSPAYPYVFALHGGRDVKVEAYRPSPEELKAAEAQEKENQRLANQLAWEDTAKRLAFLKDGFSSADLRAGDELNLPPNEDLHRYSFTRIIVTDVKVRPPTFDHPCGKVVILARGKFDGKEYAADVEVLQIIFLPTT